MADLELAQLLEAEGGEADEKPANPADLPPLPSVIEEVPTEGLTEDARLDKLD